MAREYIIIIIIFADYCLWLWDRMLKYCIVLTTRASIILNRKL